MNHSWDALLAMTPTLEYGHVWLVGAGPGDPGLLTLQALSALRQADVLVYDALVDQRILDLARSDAQRIFAGKRGGKPSTQQSDIISTLIEYAQDGMRVLRLKGGDPFVFGRGGEECAALAAAGVAFQVVPGITAGLGGLSAARIPATMRGINQGIFLATGHGAGRDGHADAIDWCLVGQLGQPIILYMAMNKLAVIRSELISGGLAANTPAALIASATCPDEQIIVTTLEHVVEDAALAKIEPPTIVVFGAIVNMRETLLRTINSALAEVI